MILWKIGEEALCVEGLSGVGISSKRWYYYAYSLMDFSSRKIKQCEQNKCLFDEE